MNTIPAQLEDGTYSYARPAMGGREDTMTATVQGGQLVAGTLNGQPMTGHCWAACTLADLAYLPYTFERVTIGRARASRLHRILSRLGLGHADHYRAASAALGRMVASLAALTEQEGRWVWNHIRALRMQGQLTSRGQGGSSTVDSGTDRPSRHVFYFSRSRQLSPLYASG